MAQGQSSSAAREDVIKSIKSLETEMAKRFTTPASSASASASASSSASASASASASEDEPSVVCPISWAGSDGFDRSDYEPAKVCIGPFHRGKQAHASWEMVKMDALHRLLPGDDQQRRELELEHYLEAMTTEIEANARWYYSRPFHIKTEEFRCMLLVDGCFLHTRFVPRKAAPAAPAQTDIRVDRDIVFLLENQLPFFVLEEIQKLIVPDASDEVNKKAVADSVVARVQALLQESGYSAATGVCSFAPPPCHLLHLLHMYFRPELRTVRLPFWRTCVKNMKEKIGVALAAIITTSGCGRAAAQPGTELQELPISVPQDYRRWSSATYYYAAGVKFKPRKVGGGDGQARSILDVELRGSTLHVPCLTVDEYTFGLLRNMVALEQRSSTKLSKSHVTTYCFFLSQLAGTKEDVKLLIAKKIIVHMLQDEDEVAAGLAGLCEGTVIHPNDTDPNYLGADYEKLEKLSKGRLRKSMAWLRHTKCSNICMGLGVVAAFVILVCTIEQAVFAALPYIKRK